MIFVIKLQLLLR